MSPVDGWNQYVYAVNTRTEEKLFTRWINGYQATTPFDEFKRLAGFGPRTENVTEAEALEKVRRVLNGAF